MKHNGITILRRRLLMFRRDPHCYWCGVRVALSGEGQPDFATVDHLYSKMHPLRPVKHKTGDRTAVLHVLACAECNQTRGRDDQQGRVFIPKLASRRVIAEDCSAVIGHELCGLPNGPAPVMQLPVKRALLDETVRGFGWTDNNGDLRPRSWEEYVKHRPAFIGEAFERRIKPKAKRTGFCTIGELLNHRLTVNV